MLIQLFIDFPCYSEVIDAFRQTSNYSIAMLLILQIRLRLSSVEVVKIRMFNDTSRTLCLNVKDIPEIWIACIKNLPFKFPTSSRFVLFISSLSVLLSIHVSSSSFINIKVRHLSPWSCYCEKELVKGSLRWVLTNHLFAAGAICQANNDTSVSSTIIKVLQLLVIKKN